ncbi:hypothetical protein, partial [Escherichia coli]|uniref:hypothetical protein n=1 Tax=Escherichia coli TaxID=562 RepID=UPI0019D561A3
FAPGTIAAGCGATVDAATGLADRSFDTDQLADDAAGAGGVVNVGVATAAGADGIDGACVAAVAPRNTS